MHPNTVELIEQVAQKVEQTGIQAWWDLDAAELLGEDAANYEKVLDTLDVWFDSGATHYAVVNQRPEFNGHEADMYLEGSDQHRGWFQSSLMTSVAIKNHAPYKQVLTHGFTVDGQGRKMSKSIGNVVSPQEVMNKLGGDILRLWVASTDYTGEMTVSDQILNRSADAYRRIRNTARFLLANLNGFNPETDMVAADELVAADRWAVGKALEAQEEIVKAFEECNFHAVTQRLMQFCSVEMVHSTWTSSKTVSTPRKRVATRTAAVRQRCSTSWKHWFVGWRQSCRSLQMKSGTKCQATAASSYSLKCGTTDCLVWAKTNS